MLLFFGVHWVVIEPAMLCSTLDSIPIIHQPKFKALSVENPPEFLLRLLTIISQHASVNHEVQIRTSAVSDGEKVTIPFLQRSLEAVARADEFLAAQLGEEVVTRGGGACSPKSAQLLIRPG